MKDWKRRRMPRPGHPTYMQRTMTMWLHDAGYHCCCHCRIWYQRNTRNKKLCPPCTVKESADRRARHKIAELNSDDWGARANAYFASQIDPTYYSDLRLRHRSSLGLS